MVVRTVKRTVKLESLAYVNMRCHTYPEMQSAPSHHLCIKGAECAEETPYVSRLQCSGKTDLKTHNFFQSSFKLDVATCDVLFWKHVSVVSIIYMMEIFSVGLANKLRGIFKRSYILSEGHTLHLKFLLIVFFLKGDLLFLQDVI